LYSIVAGAGMDSFFETLLKSHILLGDSDLLQWFDDAYSAAQHHTLYKVILLGVFVINLILT
jgi:hypothetical protein